MTATVDAALDEIQSRRGTLALYKVVQKYPVLQYADVTAELAARIDSCEEGAERETSEWLKIVVLFLDDYRADGDREAFSQYFMRSELVVSNQVSKKFVDFGKAEASPDGGLSILKTLTPELLALLGEMLERQVVGMQLDGDLIFYRTFQERLEFLRAYASGSPLPVRKKRVPERTAPVADGSAIYKRRSQVVVATPDYGGLRNGGAGCFLTMREREWRFAPPVGVSGGREDKARPRSWRGAGPGRGRPSPS
jgi:hypothetical protein